MTNDGQNTLVYDAENRILSATNGGASGSYNYDGNSLRVMKVSGGTTTVYVFSGTKVIAEYAYGAPPSSPTREYVYSGGALLAKIESGATKYYHQDHLSNRVVTDSSGNDYAMARSYINRLARFSSPDPLSGSIGNPQSFNRFAYTTHDPVNVSDPMGLTNVKAYQNADPGAFAAWMALASSSTTWSWVSTGGHWAETTMGSIFGGEPIWVSDGYWTSSTLSGWGGFGLDFSGGGLAGGWRWCEGS
jgi:RHS repeat-associated protein